MSKQGKAAQERLKARAKAKKAKAKAKPKYGSLASILPHHPANKAKRPTAEKTPGYFRKVARTTSKG